MKFNVDRVCDVCGRRRGAPFNHAACSKIRQARGGMKETIRSARPNRDTVDYLTKTGERG